MIASWDYFDRVRAVAAKIGACEVAGFLIENRGAKLHLEEEIHYRPDLADLATKANAIAAFKEIVTSCILQHRDGAIRVSNEGDSAHPQFCLVHLESDLTRVLAYIKSRTTDDDALAALNTIKLQKPFG